MIKPIQKTRGERPVSITSRCSCLTPPPLLSPEEGGGVVSGRNTSILQKQLCYFGPFRETGHRGKVKMPRTGTPEAAERTLKHWLEFGKERERLEEGVYEWLG